MKARLFALLLIAIAPSSAMAAEVHTVTLSAGSGGQPILSPSIDIPSGYCLEAKEVFSAAAVYQNKPYVMGTLSVGGSSFPVSLGSSRLALFSSKIYGPATLVVKNIFAYPTTLQYTLTPDTQDASASPPVAVPGDNAASYTAILESSNDLSTWVPVQPGSYPSTTDRRFFRTRLQKN